MLGSLLSAKRKLDKPEIWFYRKILKMPVSERVSKYEIFMEI